MFADTTVSTFSVRIEVSISAVNAIHRKLTRVSTQWPGYKMWNGQVRISDLLRVLSQKTKRSHIQFRARSWGGTNEPITRSRLAMQIAKRVIEFLEVSLSVPTEWSALLIR